MLPEIPAPISASANPAIRLRASLLLGLAPDSPGCLALRQQVAASDQAKGLLQGRAEDGKIPLHAYAKWQGAHFTLYSLAELGYPPGDESLRPLLGQVYDWLYDPDHFKYPRTVVYPEQPERVRRCGSQEANAIWYALKLGLDDERTTELVERLIGWQWPDGGWNCDKTRKAGMSSLLETIYPLRALALFGQQHRDERARKAARAAAEVMLERHLYKRRRDGSVIHPDFTRITFPYFAHYSFFFALKVLCEANLVDERCKDALDLLESKRLADGSFPLERKIHQTVSRVSTRGTWIDWGPSGKQRGNEWVTVDGLAILRQAGRLAW